jgi:hypothetical protein
MTMLVAMMQLERMLGAMLSRPRLQSFRCACVTGYSSIVPCVPLCMCRRATERVYYFVTRVLVTLLYNRHFELHLHLATGQPSVLNHAWPSSRRAFSRLRLRRMMTTTAMSTFLQLPLTFEGTC